MKQIGWRIWLVAIILPFGSMALRPSRLAAFRPPKAPDPSGLQAAGQDSLKAILPAGIHFQPVFNKNALRLNEPLQTQDGDLLTLQTLRFYLTHLVFLKNGKAVFEEKNSYHLLDLEAPSSLDLRFDLPASVVFDEIQFDLGVDSLTNTAGAMGGDLDPTRGMFWAWQSGYINAKIEGFSSKCPARNHEFQFHIGGYLPPFLAVKRVNINLGKVQHFGDVQLDFDLAPFFQQIDWAKKHSIMSPSAEAVAMSEILSKSFSLHAE